MFQSVFLSLPADGAEVQHTLPTRLHILCLASENRACQLHQGQYTLRYCPCQCQVTLNISSHLGRKAGHGWRAEGCSLAAGEAPGSFSRREDAEPWLLLREVCCSQLRLGMLRAVQPHPLHPVRGSSDCLSPALAGLPGSGHCTQGLLVKGRESWERFSFKCSLQRLSFSSSPPGTMGRNPLPTW